MGLQTKGSLVRFPVRAHAWVAGQVPSRGVHGRQPHIDVSLLLSPSLPLSLKINKIFKKKLKHCFYSEQLTNVTSNQKEKNKPDDTLSKMFFKRSNLHEGVDLATGLGHMASHLSFPKTFDVFMFNLWLVLVLKLILRTPYLASF